MADQHPPSSPRAGPTPRRSSPRTRCWPPRGAAPRRSGVAPIGSGGGAALRFLASVLDARAVVEIGTGTGVSGLWLLRGMRADGVLTTVDIEAEHQRLARETFTEAGVAQHGPAPSPVPRSTCCRGSPTATTTWSSADGDKARVRRLPQGGAAAAAPRRRGGLRQRAVARPGRRPRPARRGDRGHPRARPRGRRARVSWCRCCCPSATGCWSPRRSGRPSRTDPGGATGTIPRLPRRASSATCRGPASRSRPGRWTGAARRPAPTR